MAKTKKNRQKRQHWGLYNTASSGTSKPRVALTAEENAQLHQKLRNAYSREPHDFQFEGIKAQIEGVDMLVHASTGAGKTTIAAGPHLWIPNGVTLVATPLITLAEEMVSVDVVCAVLSFAIHQL